MMNTLSQLWQHAPDLPRLIKNDAEDWCREKQWALRAACIPIFIWVLIQELRIYNDPFVTVGFTSPIYFMLNGVHLLNLGIHELGHELTRAFGLFVSIVGGSFIQCLAPVLATFMFLKQRDYFAIAVMGFWLGVNLSNVAIYIGDSRSQSLPLVSPRGGDPIHDWNFILSKFGILRHDTAIAFACEILALGCMAAAILFIGWLCYRMAYPKERETIITL